MSDNEIEYEGYKFDEGYKVHRIVLKNILTEDQNLPEDIDRNLSIPFSGNIRPVWAPNGYGKTFAFKILSLLNRTNIVPQIGNYSHTPFTSLNNFFRLCYNEIYPSSNTKDYFSELTSKLSSQKFNKKLIPFTEIIVRLVDSKNTEVVDISIIPNWELILDDYELSEINSSSVKVKRKFWNVKSLNNPFFEKYPDNEIEDILKKNKSIYNSIIKPIFFEKSFLLPNGNISLFRNYDINLFELPTEDKNYLPEAQCLIFSKEIVKVIRSLKEEGQSINYEVEWLDNDNTLMTYGKYDSLDKLETFCISDVNEINSLVVEDYIREGQELLLELFEIIEMNKKYGLPSIIASQYSIPHNINYEGKADLLNYLFILFDAYLHDSEFNERDTENLHLPWRVLSGNISNYLINTKSIISEYQPITADIFLPHPKIWNEEGLLDALANLNITYFEIPSIINYSSELKLQSAQRDMTNILKIISSSGNSDQEEVYLENSNQRIQDFISLLNYLKNILGRNRPDTLKQFLGPLTKFWQWDELLEDLLSPERFKSSNEIFDKDVLTPNFLEEYSFEDDVFRNFLSKNRMSGEEIFEKDFSELIEMYYDEIIKDKYDFTIPYLFSPSNSFKLDGILRFVEIFENINVTLNSDDTKSWPASCHFGEIDEPMKFEDPTSRFRIDTRHLSFGQCSVVALEVCIGRGLFINQHISHLGRKYQSCIVLDEPEVGRSEYWVEKISERINETVDEFEKPNFGNIFNQSMIVISHRETLLRSFNIDKNYYIMQPDDEDGEEE